MAESISWNWASNIINLTSKLQTIQRFRYSSISSGILKLAWGFSSLNLFEHFDTYNTPHHYWKAWVYKQSRDTDLHQSVMESWNWHGALLPWTSPSILTPVTHLICAGKHGLNLTLVRSDGDLKFPTCDGWIMQSGLGFCLSYNSEWFGTQSLSHCCWKLWFQSWLWWCVMVASISDSQRQ